MEVSLNHVRPGMDARVVAVAACGALGCRFRAAGLVAGARVRCCGKSPNGQVTALELDGNRLQMQTRDLEKIRVAIRRP